MSLPQEHKDEALHVRWLIGLTLGLLLLSLLLNLGKDPLLMEEERRAMIAQEMDLQGNYIVPTQIGDHYFMKPPFFNWVLIGMWKLTGGPGLFNTRMVSVMSLLLLALGHYRLTRKYLSAQVAFYSSLFIVISAEIYFYYSMRAEIDLFYSMISYFAIVAVFHFWERNNLLMMFLGTYVLNACGVLTKGPPSVIFLVGTLGLFLLVRRQLGKLFTWQHLVGIMAFLLIVGGWAWAYSSYDNPMGFVSTLNKESMGRTGLSKSRELAGHLVTFPLGVLAGILPAGLLVFFAFRKGWLREVWRQPYLQFMLLMLVHLVPYWLSPGTRSRYIFMLYPFPITLVVWAWFSRSDRMEVLAKALKLLAAISLGGMALVGLLVSASPYLTFPWPMGTSIESLGGSTGAMLAGLCITMVSLAAFLAWWRRQRPVLIGIALAVIAARIAFDLVALPLRAAYGDHVDGWNAGFELARRTEGKTLWLYKFRGPGAFPFGGAFTYDRASGKVLRNTRQINCEDYYVGLEQDFKGREYSVVWEFLWQKDRKDPDGKPDPKRYLLVKFTGCDSPR